MRHLVSQSDTKAISMASRSGWMLCVFIICFFLATTVDAAASKYSKDVNLNKKAISDSERPFRMNKINLLWEKAQKNLDRGQLTDLYNELTIQDRLEVETKRKIADGFDEDGSHQAITRNRLLDILSRFGLRRLHEDHMDNRIDADMTEKYQDVDYRKLDKRLGKLLHKAEKAGFTAGQLADLKQELLHHQQKLDEFDSLRNDINAADEISPNAIHGFRDSTFDRREHFDKKQKLKSMHQHLKEDYLFLERMSDEHKDALEFTEPQVITLWGMAQKGNFSETELASLKEELRHFKHRLKKHAVFQKEAEMAGGNFKSFGKVNDPLAQEKLSKLDDRVTDYQRKLKKVHTELKTRIAKKIRHSEL